MEDVPDGDFPAELIDKAPAIVRSKGHPTVWKAGRLQWVDEMNASPDTGFTPTVCFHPGSTCSAVSVQFEFLGQDQLVSLDLRDRDVFIDELTQGRATSLHPFE